MIVSAGFAAFILLCATVVFGQQANDFQDAKIISLPKPDLPKEAKATGFGGKVSVVVSIDESGKVTSATDVTGPDWVCPSVDRPDVVALRNAARNASLKAKFSPAAQEGKPVKSMLRLNYEFPKKPIGGLSTSYVEGARVVGTLDNDGSSKPNATANNNGPTKTIIRRRLEWNRYETTQTTISSCCESRACGWFSKYSSVDRDRWPRIFCGTGIRASVASKCCTSCSLWLSVHTNIAFRPAG